MKILPFIFLSSFASYSFAGTSSSFQMKGLIASKLELEITPEAVSSNLNLHQSQTDLKIAKASALSNSPKGYKILVSSDTEGALKHYSGTQLIPYSMKYAGLSIPLTKAPVEFMSVGKLSTISYNGKPTDQLAAGIYQDTIRFTIQSR
jgi:hypothetical protein